MNVTRIILHLLVAMMPVVASWYAVAALYIIAGYKRSRAVSYFPMLLFAAAVYTVGFYREILSDSAQTAETIRLVSYGGIIFMPAFCLLFAMQLVEKPCPKSLKAALYGFSSALYLMLLSNSAHHLFYRSIASYINAYGYRILTTEKGPLFFVLLLYIGFSIIYSTVIISKTVRSVKLNKRRVVSLHFVLVSLQIPWLAILATLAGLDKTADLAPAAVALICGLFAVNEYRNDLLQLDVNEWKKNHADSRQAMVLTHKSGEVVGVNRRAEELIAAAGTNEKDFTAHIGTHAGGEVSFALSGEPQARWFSVRKREYGRKDSLFQYILEDITEIKREAELTGDFFNAIDDLFFICDPEGSILFCNEPAARILDYSADQLKGMSLFDLYDPSRKDEAREAFDKVLRREDLSGDIPILSSTGRPVYVESRFWTGEWCGQKVVYGLSKNVAGIRAARERFEKFFENNPSVMAVTDLSDNKIIHINKAFTLTLGYSREEVIGRTAAELKLFHQPETREKLLDRLFEGEPITRAQVRIRHKDGSLRQGLFSAEVIRAGDRQELLTVMVDITENERKDRLMEITTDFAQALVAGDDYLDAVALALPRLGECLSLDRVYLSVNKTAQGTAEPQPERTAEWCAQDIPSMKNQPAAKENAFTGDQAILRAVPYHTACVCVTGTLEDGEQKRFLQSRGVETILLIPVHVNGELWGFFGFEDCRKSRKWLASERIALQSFADSLSMAVEKHISTALLVESEAKFRGLIEQMQQGLAVFDMILDERGRAVDFRLSAMNRSFETLTGLSTEQFDGKTVMQVVPDTARGWIENFSGAVFRGEPYQFEQYSERTQRFFSCSAFSPEKGRVAVILTDITETKRINNELKTLAARLELAVKAGGIGIWEYDAADNTLVWDDQMYALYGISRKYFDSFYKNWQDGVHPGDIDRLAAELRMALSGEKELNTEYRICWPNGEVHNMRVLAAVERNGDGKAVRMTGTIWDITPYKQLQAKLAEEKSLLETTLMSVGDGVISTDHRGRIVFLNRAAESMTGLSLDKAKGRPVEEVLRLISAQTRQQAQCPAVLVLQDNKTYEAPEDTLLLSADGTEYAVEAGASPIVGEAGEVTGAVVVFSDWSEKKKRQEKIEYLSYHDQLTGVYNRRYFDLAMARIAKENILPLTMVLADVNGLKLTNDAFGHLAGDILLKKAAHALQKECGPDDMVFRIGGDEFMLVLPGVDESAADKIISDIKKTVERQHVKNIVLSLSIGSDTRTQASQSIDEVIKKAEDAMYKRKLSESMSMRSRTIDLIMTTLFEKNKREMLHSERVSVVGKNIAIAMGLPEGTVDLVALAGMMHDIGKIGIDERILNSEGKLSAEERMEIQRHSEIGYRILSSSDEFVEISKYVLEHHERFDGAGYPRGLKGQEITLGARIIAVADSFDAIVSYRTYRESLSVEDAAKEIIRCSGYQFDPEVVEAFVGKVLAGSGAGMER